MSVPESRHIPFDVRSSPIETGATLIAASAGTGKTFAITGIVMRLLLEDLVPDLSKILVVTFTEAATGELKSRLRSVIHQAVQTYSGGPGPESPFDDFLNALPDLLQRDSADLLKRSEEALAQLDQAAIFTIHGFCSRLLSQAAFESGQPFGTELLSDPSSLIDRIGRDYWHRTIASDALLSDLAIAASWKLDDFLKLRQLFTRFPNTRLDPKSTSASVSAASREVHHAIMHLVSAWRPEQIRALASEVNRNKDCPLQDNLIDATFESVTLLIEGHFIGVLSGLTAFAEGTFTDTFHKNERESDIVAQLDAHPSVLAIRGVLAAIEEVKRALMDDFIQEVTRAYDTERIESGLLTFDDQLKLVKEALGVPGTESPLKHIVASTYDAALIDEFQDTDLLQYDIFSTLFSGKYLFYIGDPKQSIYRFRGADIEAYLVAAAKADRERTLAKNYRSSPEMVESVNALFGRPQSPFLRAEIEYVSVAARKPENNEGFEGDDCGALVWWYVGQNSGGGAHAVRDADRLILPALVREVNHLLRCKIDGKQVRLQDIGILVRKHEQARFIRDGLAEAGISSIMGKTGNVYESFEAEELHLVLTAILNSRDSSTVSAALVTDLWGCDAQELVSLQRNDRKWQEIGQILSEWKSIWERDGLARLLREIIDRLTLHEKLLLYFDGERRLTNIGHLVELLHLQEVESHATPESLLGWFTNKRENPIDERETTELRLESDTEAVRISTIHAAKGLEYPIVFAPYLWQASKRRKNDPLILRDDPRHAVLSIDPNRDQEYNLRAEMDRLAEDARLTYVALTRAKHRCYVVWGHLGSRSGAADSALAFLLHAFDIQVPDPASWYSAIQEQIKKSKPRWLTDLKELVKTNQEVMSLTVLNGQSAVAVLDKSDDEADRSKGLAARRLEPHEESRLQAFEMTSFSGISPGIHAEVDWDESDAITSIDPSHQPAPEPIYAFAKGAATGLCWHALLEKWDFGTSYPLQEIQRNQIVAQLGRHGLLDSSVHNGPIDAVETTEQMLRVTCSTRLPNANFRLSDITPGQRLNEWRFYLPFSSEISLSRFAFALSGKLSSHLEESYLASLQTWSRPIPDGFLTGFADLIFEHGGKWHLIDWKSNHLGSSPVEYAREALVGPMCDNHYILQYHLYLLALHRYLSWRLRDYEYDRHIGEVWYIFLRGLDGSGNNGIFHDRPTRDAIYALDQLFE